MHVYEVRARKNHRGVDLISDVLPFGRLTTDFRCGPASQDRAPDTLSSPAESETRVKGNYRFPPDSIKCLGSESGGFFLKIPSRARCYRAVTIQPLAISDPRTLYSPRRRVIESSR